MKSTRRRKDRTNDYEKIAQFIETKGEEGVTVIQVARHMGWERKEAQTVLTSMLSQGLISILAKYPTTYRSRVIDAKVMRLSPEERENILRIPGVQETYDSLYELFDLEHGIGCGEIQAERYLKIIHDKAQQAERLIEA